MPFGLINAPSTFQSSMNQVFTHYLRKFILVYFDDILIYSSSWKDHLLHLEEVFRTLRANKLIVKKSKCAFERTQVDYLGHINSVHGVAMDKQKESVVLNWPQPTTIKGLRGFLGLIGYYRRFVQGYGIIARPLTDLLKKGSFTWSESTTQASEQLKVAITSALILPHLDFTKEFVVENDASGDGIRG